MSAPRSTGVCRRRPAAGLVVAAVGVALLALVPLGFVVWSTVDAGWGEVRRLVLRGRTLELLWNTVRLTGGAVLLSAVLGTGAAWLVERSTLPGRRLWTVLMAAPLAVPAFVNSYGWVSLMPAASGYGGALVIVTLSYFPFVYLSVAAALRGLDPALEETAYSLGDGPFRTFRRVVLTQLRPALAGGCLLVALHLLAEFGALQLLRFPTFTTAIYDQYQSSFSGPAANMLAAVLVLCCLLLLLGDSRLRGNARFARVGSGVARPPARVRLGAWTVPALVALGTLAVLALGVPLGSLTYWLVTGTSSGVTVDLLLETTGTSLGLGALAALCAVIAAVPVTWLAERHRGRLATLLERSTYFGNALPGIVVALALVTLGIRVVPMWYQTIVLLVAAYVILFLPRAVVNVRAAFAQAPPVLEDVAHSQGLGRLPTLLRVTLPLAAPGLGAAGALVFIAVVTELTATLLLSPIGTRTLATQFWADSDSAAYAAAAPYALVMVLLSAPATYLLTRDIRRSSAP
ncbi:ABC transporter permease [Amycolatopsis sp. NPDC057786]|uniref:ABC transporter permease n=1 Tax=Amycolatopsis sp. NPDC057786 TaxID=3346250 RepID=UPI003672D11A